MRTCPADSASAVAPRESRRVSPPQPAPHRESRAFWKTYLASDHGLSEWRLNLQGRDRAALRDDRRSPDHDAGWHELLPSSSLGIDIIDELELATAQVEDCHIG